jgi:hypothetical protein
LEISVLRGAALKNVYNDPFVANFNSICLHLHARTEFFLSRRANCQKTVRNFGELEKYLVFSLLNEKRAVSHQKTARPKLTIFTTLELHQNFPTTPMGC